MTFSRRSFLARASLLSGAALSSRALAAITLHSNSQSVAATPAFHNADPAWQRTWNAAIDVLSGNVHSIPAYPHAVLFEGSSYQGIWQECGPHESLVYATLQREIPSHPEQPTLLEVARNSHMIFFTQQRPDGQIPASIRATGSGFGQIQMVVPIAATAWELTQFSHDDELLAAAYKACASWDAWLRQYRDTRQTGLVEGFCTYDTGHDNSPRWAGIPNRCPDGDARKCPPVASLPRLCPDLSATVYGGRVALAAMANVLGKPNEAARWQDEAEKIRQLIIDKLYCPEDAAFYDLDAQNKFVRVRSDVISRVLGEHILDPAKSHDRAIFDALWSRQLYNPRAFWAPYPLTSIAQNDPAFVRPIPPNSWGGASQALTALRALRWMPYYGKQPALDHLMRQWCEAIMRHTEFCQQLNPLTGEFTRPDPGGYSPAALVFLEFARRLSKPAAAAATNSRQPS